MNENYKKLLAKQGYALAGDHSVVKVCGWTKKGVKSKGTCYKHKFYGINSHRCTQMSPSANQCFMNCIFCWRTRNESPFTSIDDPEQIIDESIKAHTKLMVGFKGNEEVTEQKFNEAMVPKHFAISLTGEPTAYPKISEFVAGLHKRGISTFIVTNGMFPETLRKMTKPTQLYVSLDAPNKELFQQIDLPDLKDAWERLNKTLELMKEIQNETRTTIRVTAIKGMNMCNPEQWGELLKKADPMFIEVKGYVFVGASRQRLNIDNMPRHHEVKAFAKEIGKACGYKYIDEQEASRVILLMKEDRDDRFIKWDWETADTAVEMKEPAIPIEEK